MKTNNKPKIITMDILDNDFLYSKEYKDVQDIFETNSMTRKFSNYLRRFRIDNNYTQKDLADILEVNPVMISKYENGMYNPTIKQLLKVSYALMESRYLYISLIKNALKELDKLYSFDKDYNKGNNTLTLSKMKILPFENDNDAFKIKKRMTQEEIDSIIILKSISEVIKTYRLNNNYSQKDLADILGMNQVYVCKLEKGTLNLSFKHMMKLSYRITGDRSLFVLMMKYSLKQLEKEYPMKKDNSKTKIRLKKSNINKSNKTSNA